MHDVSEQNAGAQQLPASLHRTVVLVTLALAVGSFGIGTGEFVIMGLLPEVARTFAISTPEAGQVITAYALGVVVGAPLIAVFSAKLSRKLLLICLMTIFGIGNLASALAPDFWSLLALRFLSGLPHGAYFGVASLVAASVVPPEKGVTAVSRVMLGLTIATLIGIPVTAYFGQLLSWRIAFIFVGTLGFVTLTLIAFLLPRDRIDEGASILRELGALRRIQVWMALAVGAVGFGGMFAIFSYVALTATEVAHLDARWIPLLLAAFGVGMNVGNIIGARLGDRSLKGMIIGVMVMNIVSMTLYGLSASNPIMLFTCVFLVGCGFAAAPAIQTRLMDVAADAQTLAAASNHSAFNIANALGAWLGGIVISSGYIAADTGYVGAILSALGLAVFLASVRMEKRT
ncbi:MAG: MFS transporter [Alphaproteobacteria bacterium]|nr:MAG: MFS transporter [Alphaproteobacteria bacterium]